MKAVNSINKTKTAMILAGGTGGHIYPGLAVAEGLRDQGWSIVWLGAQNGMEDGIAKSNNFKFECIQFSGLRGKGIKVWLLLPFRLLKALWQSALIIYKIKPTVILGFGGYTAFPAGFMGCVFSKPLILHEQNSIAGLSNKVLAYFATRVFTAFPNVMKNAIWIGNPLRSEFYHQPEPSIRFENRKGPLKILILGGSLGAKFLNQVVPQAINLLPISLRPLVKHQSGANQLDELIKNYQQVNVQADLIPFIKNTADAFADADLIICRSGASTVTEISAVGAAALFIPFPSAVDDHQTKNAMYLVERNAGWMLSQHELTPAKLAKFIQNKNRSQLTQISIEAKKLQKENTLQILINTCESLIK